MKKTITLSLLFLALMPRAAAQCDDPVQLPYLEDVNSAAIPAIPGCMSTRWNSFASMKVFESTNEPVPGFTGNLLVYDTAVDTQFGTQPDSPVNAFHTTPTFAMQQGVAYRISFRYANSDPDKAIGRIALYLSGPGAGNAEIGLIENITGAVAADYVSAEFSPPATGNYWIDFDVFSAGTQGLLYLDDIEVQASGQMGTGTAVLSALAVYPNPAGNVLNIQNDFPVDSVELYSVSGQLLLSEKPQSAVAAINLGSLSSGVYIAHIKCGHQTTISRIVKE